MGKKRSFTDTEYVRAVAASKSWGGVMRLLNLKAGGGTYEHLKGLAPTLGADTSHFTGQAWSRGLTGRPAPPSKRPIEVYLTGRHPIGSSGLRQRLIKEGLKKAECETCGITKWRGLPAPLELDHINGVRNDNRLSNLRILCPNCHAQTPTYCAKNKRA